MVIVTDTEANSNESVLSLAFEFLRTLGHFASETILFLPLLQTAVISTEELGPETL